MPIRSFRVAALGTDRLLLARLLGMRLVDGFLRAIEAGTLVFSTETGRVFVSQIDDKLLLQSSRSSISKTLWALNAPSRRLGLRLGRQLKAITG